MGLASALLFVEQGAKVIVTARSAETFAKAKKDYGQVLDVVQCDVSSLTDLDTLYKYIETKYKKLDVVFANAGIGGHRLTTLTDLEIYDRVMNTNLKGVYFTVAKAIPLLNDGSSVILNGSAVAEMGISGASVYAATKAALRSLVRSWTAEIPPSKVRFNVVSPGVIKTPIRDRLGKEKAEEFEAAFVAKTPIKRIGTSEEIATVALFLASSDSSYVCGANIAADGGLAQI